jgi:hypothetical protein
LRKLGLQQRPIHKTDTLHLSRDRQTLWSGSNCKQMRTTESDAANANSTFQSAAAD